MSLNKYDAATGTLTTLANGQRIWLGTKAAHDAAEAAGTLPTNCLIAITNDGDIGGVVDFVEEDNMNAVTSNAVYNELQKYSSYKQKTLGAIGWYRVAKLRYNVPCLIRINHSWNHSGSTSATIIWNGHNIIIQHLEGTGSGPIVNDFRFSLIDNFYYLDIYYNLSETNTIWTYIIPFNTLDDYTTDILNYENVTSETGVTYIEPMWDNPPLLTGIEYKTTEKFMNKPVYIKMCVSNASTTIPGSGAAYATIPGWSFTGISTLVYWHTSIDVISYHGSNDLSKWATLYTSNVNVPASSWIIAKYTKI